MLEPEATSHTIYELKRKRDWNLHKERAWEPASKLGLVDREVLLVLDPHQVCGFKFCDSISQKQNRAHNTAAQACCTSVMMQQTKIH